MRTRLRRAKTVCGGFAVLFLLAVPLADLAAQGNDNNDTTTKRYELDGQVRYRYEADARRAIPGHQDSYRDVHYLRTRAQARFMPLKDVEAVVQIQDSRSFGSENGLAGRGTLDGSADMLDLHQGYFRVKDLFGSGVDIQVGRQEMAYANERLIGSVGWSNVGRAFDAIRLRTADSWGAVDVFASRLQNVPEANVRSQNLYGAWGTLALAKKHNADLFVLLDNNTATISNPLDSGAMLLSRMTFGTFVQGSVSSLEYSGEFAYQGGTVAVGDTIQQEHTISAIMLSGTVGVKFDPVKISALFTLLSGDDNGSDAEEKTFNTLFATNHKFYGYMDYFPASYQSAGLMDIALSALWKISDDASLGVDAHLFSSAVDVQVDGQKDLGKEIDMTFKYKYNKAVAFTGGVSLFLADQLMENLIGKETAVWGYLMTTVSL